MSFGYFSLTVDANAYGGTPATGYVQVDGIPQVVKDTAGNKVEVGPRKVTLDPALGTATVSLPSDSTTGNSTGIFYRASLHLKHQPDAGVAEFFAPPIGSTLAFADIVPASPPEDVGATAANVIAAQAAADRAEAFAAAIDPDAYPGVITPEQYGAAGNGTTDDTTAVNTAATAAAATTGSVLWAAKRYRMTAPLLVDSNLHVVLPHLSSRILRDWVGGQPSTQALFRNRDFATKANNVSITGPGALGATSWTATGKIISLYGDDQLYNNMRVDTFAGGQAFTIGGNRIRMFGVRIGGAPATSGTGGIRLLGGDDFVCVGAHVECGDDSLQAVPTPGASNVMGDMSIRRAKYIGCTGVSTTARFMAVVFEDASVAAGVMSFTGNISGVEFIGCSGTGSGRGVIVMNSSSSGVVERVKFLGGSVTMANTGGVIGVQDCLLNSYNPGGVRDVLFSDFTIMNPLASSYVLSTIGAVYDVRVRDCAVTGRAGMTALLDFSYTVGVQVRGGIFDLNGATDGIRGGTGTNGTTDIDVQSVDVRNVPDGGYGVNFNTVTRGSVRTSRFTPATGSTTGRAVRVGTTATGVSVEGNDMTRMPVTVTLSATDVVARGNRGLNPAGSVTAPTLPATNVDYINTLGYDASVFITGGTVSAIRVGGVLTGLTTGAFHVMVGAAVRVTYTVAPTWTWTRE